MSEPPTPNGGGAGRAAARFDPIVCMADGVRRVDYVLVCVERVARDAESEPGAHYRRFEEHLRLLGLQLEEGTMVEEIRFMLVHAPFDVLSRQAEVMRIRKPVAVKEGRRRGAAEKAPFLGYPAEVHKRCDPLAHYYEEYTEKGNEIFDGIDQPQTFFTTCERTRIVQDLLARTKFGDDSKMMFGVERLKQLGAIKDHFAMHEPLLKTGDEDAETMSTREILYKHWSRFALFHRRQPIDLVESYFGPKIGFFFAFRGFYTQRLIYIAIVGLVVSVAGVIFSEHDIPSNQICDQKIGWNMTLCSPHKHPAQLHQLGENCAYAKITYVFDNPLTMLMAVVTAVWTTLMLEMWKRTNLHLNYRWSLLGYEEQDEVVRPEYQRNCTSVHRNRITMEKEMGLPWYHRWVAGFVSTATMVFFCCIILALMVSLLFYNIVVNKATRHMNKTAGSLLASASSGAISLACMMVLSHLYNWVAWRLTQWECPRTEAMFDDRLAVKKFGFEFVNTYAIIFYVAFFRGKSNGVPPNQEVVSGPHYFDGWRLFGRRPEACNVVGCMTDLVIQLFVIMCGKQFAVFAWDFGKSTLTQFCRKKIVHYEKLHDEHPDLEDELNIVERNYSLNKYPTQFLLDEYLNLAIQFGFCAMFTPAFPLTPLFVLIHNMLKIRGDAFKLVQTLRRPPPQVVHDIGIWFKILEFVVSVGVFVNAAVISFTTDLIPRFYHMLLNGGSLETYLQEEFDTMFVTVKHTPTLCYFRNEWNKFNKRFFIILALRLGFVLVFENLLLYFVPAMPARVFKHRRRFKILHKRNLISEDRLKLAYQSGEELESENEMDEREVVHDGRDVVHDGRDVLNGAHKDESKEKLL